VRDRAGRRCVLTSRRKSRHAGIVGLWLLTDPAAAAGRVEARTAQLAALPHEPEQRTFFD
jgi:hypothetical protein